MAFVHSKDTRVFVNEVSASAKLRSIGATSARALGDVTAFGDDGNKFIPGLRAGSFAVEGHFEDNTLLDEFEAADGVDNSLLVSTGFAGFTVGNPVVFAAGDLQTHSVASAITDPVSFTVDMAADEFVDIGRSLHAITAETATANGASVDNTTSSTNGGVGVLHVTTASAADTLDVKIQHSVDDSVWVDLITFTQATAATSQRLTVTGTVNRYVRAIWTIAGTSPSFTFVAAFARR